MKKLNNTENKLKKSVAYKKSVNLRETSRILNYFLTGFYFPKFCEFFDMGISLVSLD